MTGLPASSPSSSWPPIPFATPRLRPKRKRRKYFNVGPKNNEFSLTDIQVFITEDQRSTVSGFSTGQDVTVVGTITGVGEVLGYSMDATSIK